MKQFFRIDTLFILSVLLSAIVFNTETKSGVTTPPKGNLKRAFSRSLPCTQTFLPVTANFLTMTYFDAPAPYNQPADTIGAIGTQQFLAASPEGIITYDRNGNKDHQLDTNINSFFNILTGIDTDAYAPQVRFDPFSMRWFILCINANFDSVITAPEQIYLAASSSDVITTCTPWNIVKLPQDQIPPVGNIGDGLINPDPNFPTLGIDQTKLYVGTNLYLPGTATFDSAAVFVFDKQSLLSGGNGNPIAYRNLSSASNIFAPMAVDNFDTNPSFGYILGTNPLNGAELILYEIDNITNTISAPIILAVTPTADPVLIPYKNILGSEAQINPFTSRVYAAHIRNQQLFAVRHIGVDENGDSTGSVDRVAVRWTQIDLSTSTPTVVAEGTLFDPGALSSTTRFYYFPSVMTNTNNTMVIAGSLSSSDEFISGFAAHLCVGSAVDNTVLRNSVQIVAQGVASYNASSFVGLVEIWGGYTATSLDPVDQKSLWTIVPYVSSYGAWGARVAALQG